MYIPIVKNKAKEKEKNSNVVYIIYTRILTSTETIKHINNFCMSVCSICSVFFVCSVGLEDEMDEMSFGSLGGVVKTS